VFVRIKLSTELTDVVGFISKFQDLFLVIEHGRDAENHDRDPGEDDGFLGISLGPD